MKLKFRMQSKSTKSYSRIIKIILSVVTRRCNKFIGTVNLYRTPNRKVTTGAVLCPSPTQGCWAWSTEARLF